MLEGLHTFVLSRYVLFRYKSFLKGLPSVCIHKGMQLRKYHRSRQSVLLYQRDEHVQAATVCGSLPGVNGTSRQQFGRLAFLVSLSFGLMPGYIQHFSSSQHSA